MGDLLTLHFWFSYYYLPISDRAKMILLIFAALLLVGAIILFWLKRKKDLYAKLRQSLFSFCVTNVVIAAFLGFFIYEEVPFLSSHFWLLLWLLEMVIWSWYLVKGFKTVPAIKKRIEEQKNFNKYLPK
jgi:glucan phosphoethanolaminetransferase (alkaline phosphatase superfamily)